MRFDFLSVLVVCCCPSFGCARKHSVSTYASILAGSPGLFSVPLVFLFPEGHVNEIKKYIDFEPGFCLMAQCI